MIARVVHSLVDPIAGALHRAKLLVVIIALAVVVTVYALGGWWFWGALS